MHSFHFFSIHFSCSLHFQEHSERSSDFTTRVDASIFGLLHRIGVWVWDLGCRVLGFEAYARSRKHTSKKLATAPQYGEGMARDGEEGSQGSGRSTANVAMVRGGVRGSGRKGGRGVSANVAMAGTGRLPAASLHSSQTETRGSSTHRPLT